MKEPCNAKYYNAGKPGFALFICWLPLLLLGIPLQAATNAISWNAAKQTIDGFGISEAFHQARHIMDWPEPDRTRILKLLFSTREGVGVSILRNIIGDGGGWGNEVDGPTPTIEPAPNVWNWKGDEDQIWLMRQAKKLGCTRFISTSWSPPAWMKTVSTVESGGSLRSDAYGDYANYLSHYVRGYKQQFGIDIFAVSLQNEPDLKTRYSSCQWTGEQFRDFIKDHLRPVFARDHIHARVAVGEASNFGEKCVVPSLNDPEACARVDIVTTHAYNKEDSKKVALLPAARSKDKPIWMTEVSYFDKNDPSIADGLRWARIMHGHLTASEVNAWFYWWGACYKTNGESLLTLDLNKKCFSTTKRLYTFGNYSRFIRPGYVRLEVLPNPEEDVLVSAFKDPLTGRFVIVAINSSSSEKELALAFDGFSALSVTPHRTSATEDLSVLPEIKTPGFLNATLAPESVTTFVGKAKTAK